MPPHLLPARRRPRPLVLLTALVASCLVLPATGALAAKPVPAPSAVVANQIDLQVTGLALPPDAPGSPGLLVAAGQAFDVDALLANGEQFVPYSDRSPTELALRVTAGASRFVGPDGLVLSEQVLTSVVPAGEFAAAWTGLRLAPADVDVELTVTATTRKAASDLGPDAVRFEVVKEAVTRGLAGNAFVSKSGAGVPCEATPEAPTCVDVVLPNGVDGGVFFSTGVCAAASGCSRGVEVLQVLADLEDLDGQLYSPEAPATLIVKCDKSLCGGGGVPSKSLQVNLSATGVLTTSPACTSKGFMSGAEGHCVDYAQSKRDGSGDTYLYLLIVQDARMSIG